MSTAQECFERAELALYRAETLVGAAINTLECAKAQAQGSIAIGWARLGDALANEPRELEPMLVSSMPATVQHRGPCPVGPHCRDCHMDTHRIDPVTDKCDVCHSAAAQIHEHGIGCVGGRPRPAAPDVWTAAKAELDAEQAAKAHEHDSRMCGHQWIQPLEACRNGCGLSATEAGPHPYCPNVCPESGL